MDPAHIPDRWKQTRKALLDFAATRGVEHRHALTLNPDEPVAPSVQTRRVQPDGLSVKPDLVFARGHPEVFPCARQ